MSSEKMYRTNVRQKIKKYPNLYRIARKTIDVYSNILGPFHILPNFVIIGAPRSGTSSLYYYLTQHPSIFSCKIKEPNYFAMYYDRSLNWYKTFFPTIWSKFEFEKKQKTKFLTGEASTQYYWYPHVAKRVKKVLPNIKLIMLMRNPIDRSFSQYQMEVQHGHEKLSFEEAIKNEKNRTENEHKKMLTDESYFSPKYTMYAYIEKSLYINYVKNWLKFFSKENFLFIQSETFYKQPLTIVNKIFEFLELPIMSVDTSKILKKYTIQTINPETRKRLAEYFKPFNEKLYSLIGENFHWE